MIIKNSDDKRPALPELRKLVEDPQAHVDSKKMIEPQIKDIQAGARPGPAPLDTPRPSEGASAKHTKKPACSSCSQEVPYNVFKFCGRSKERFGGRTLCRDCQQK